MPQSDLHFGTTGPAALQRKERTKVNAGEPTGRRLLPKRQRKVVWTGRLRTVDMTADWGHFSDSSLQTSVTDLIQQ